MNPIELRGITKHYPGFDLGPADLIVPQGYVMGLVGANGAGKTTLIKAALGLIHVDSGSVRTIDRSRIGVVYDVPALMPEWRLSEAVDAIARFYPDWDRAAYDRVAGWAGLDPRKKVKELSRGMAMKLQLAIAFSHHADLLILDEPTSGLDPLARSELLDMVAEFMADPDHSVLFSSHITSDLDRVADYVTVVADGRVVTSTTRDELVDGYRIVHGTTAELDAVRPLVRGLREHAAGWEGLLATEDTVGLRSSVIETPTLDDIVVHLAKEPAHV